MIRLATDTVATRTGTNRIYSQYSLWCVQNYLLLMQLQKLLCTLSTSVCTWHSRMKGCPLQVPGVFVWAQVLTFIFRVVPNVTQCHCQSMLDRLRRTQASTLASHPWLLTHTQAINPFSTTFLLHFFFQFWCPDFKRQWPETGSRWSQTVIEKIFNISQTWWKDEMLSRHISLVVWGCPPSGLIFPCTQWLFHQGKAPYVDQRP